MDQTQLQKLRSSYSSFLTGHYPISAESYVTSMSGQDILLEDTDRYGEGEVLQSFEAEIATELGHSSAIFMASGTMAQLIAMRMWCDLVNSKDIAFHHTCHLELHEQQSYLHLHQLTAQLIGDPKSVLTLNDLKAMPRRPAVVLMELPLREIGGKLPSWQDLCQQVEYLRTNEIKVHLDGARIRECQPFYDRPLSEIGGLFDSIYVSFYKGVGGVSGAMLLGDDDWIQQSRTWLRRHGGNLVTQFPTYLSAINELTKRRNSFASYWQKAKDIAAYFSSDRLRFDPAVPHVNMFKVDLKGERELLQNNALKAAEKTGIWSFSTLVDSSLPGFHSFEWTVGDATMDLTFEQIEQVFAIIFGDDQE